MASATGTATIDFGAYPGSNEASVVISGQTTISATSAAEAYFMAETSGAHTPSDHSYVALFAALTCGIPTAATGFTIYATSEHKLQGTFSVHWVWAD
jgi:hypothetical protein